MATCIPRVDGLSTDPRVWGVTKIISLESCLRGFLNLKRQKKKRNCNSSFFYIIFILFSQIIFNIFKIISFGIILRIKIIIFINSILEIKVFL